MRKLVLLIVALFLVGCAAPPAAATVVPTEVVVQPTQTALVVVETVVVTVVPTDMPTEVPSATPMPAPTEVPPTAVPPTQAVAAPTEPVASGGPITVDDALGAGWFVSLSRSRNDFSLRCQLNKEITFTVKATDPNITQVDFFYRIQDRDTGAVFDWQNAGRMIPGADGTYTLVFSGEKVSANFRKPNAFLDYQFAGSNSTGVVGRSEKIERQVTYTFDCP